MEVVGSMINSEKIYGEQKDGEDVTENNLAMEVVKFWDGDINKECNDEEYTTDNAAGSV